MSQWTQQEVNKTINETARKATVDAAFRRLCLSDPKAAIAQVNSIPIPDSFKIRFVENEGANMTIVLPDAAQPEGELSDAALEQVAGGKGSQPTTGGGGFTYTYLPSMNPDGTMNPTPPGSVHVP